MTTSATIIRSIVIYGVCLPLAVFLGYLLADPGTSTIYVGLVLLVLVIPILLKWHHPLLVLSWNTTVVLFLLPGKPLIWLAMVAASFLISISQRILFRQTKFIHVPSMAWPLFFLLVVTLVTARFTGGIGLHAFGGDVYGGKRYITLLAAILGFFALSWHRIPKERAALYVGMFYLGGITWILATVFQWVDPSFYLIFMPFQVEFPGLGSDDTYIARMSGTTFGSLAVLSFLIAHYGIQGLVAAGKPWRLAVLLLVIAGALAGGYRGALLTVLLLLGIQFFLEGLHRTRLLVFFLLVSLLGGIAMVPLLPRLPLPVQRCFAWLPVEVDPIAKMSAEASSVWRVRIWKAVLRDVPKHLLLGKGYGIDRTAFEMASDRWTRGEEDFYRVTVTGDYHNGPLSVIMPLGIWGGIGYVWLLVASLQVLCRNYRFGDPSLKLANTFLLASFIMQTIEFLFVAGAFHLDMAKFCGTVGLSISLNGGVSRRTAATEEKKVQPPSLATILPRPKPAFGR
jgi:hypothetical protein